MTQLTKILFIRKLNAPDSDRVDKIIQRISIGAMSYATFEIIQEFHLPLYKTCQDVLIISVGGDGTMLYAMRLAAQYNSVCTGFHAGKLGFLNDFGAETDEELESSVEKLLSIIRNFSQDYSSNIETRTSIQIKAINGITIQETIPPIAFNEISISRLYSDQMVDYDLYIDGLLAGNHKANSLLVSVPNGSTAYAMSAGGAIIYPTAEVIQLVPVAPATLSSRPLIIPMDNHTLNAPTTIQVVVNGPPDTSIRIDGNKISQYDQPITSLTIQKSNKAKILHSNQWNFFTTLTTKLGWYK